MRMVLRKSTCALARRSGGLRRAPAATRRRRPGEPSTSSNSTTVYGRRRTASGQLAALVIPDITGRRPDKPCDGMLFAVFTHVDANHRALVVEQEVSQRLREFGLAHTGWTEEQERTGRTVGVSHPGPRAPDRVGYGSTAFFCPTTRLPSSSSMRSSFWRSHPPAVGPPGCRSMTTPHRRCRLG